MVLAPVALFAILSIIDYFSVKIFNDIHGTYEAMYLKTFSTVALRSFFAKCIGYLSYCTILLLIELRYKNGTGMIIAVFLVLTNAMIKIPIVGTLGVFAFLFPVFWTLMYFEMKKRETK